MEKAKVRSRSRSPSNRHSRAHSPSRSRSRSRPPSRAPYRRTHSRRNHSRRHAPAPESSRPRHSAAASTTSHITPASAIATGSPAPSASHPPAQPSFHFHGNVDDIISEYFRLEDDHNELTRQLDAFKKMLATTPLTQTRFMHALLQRAQPLMHMPLFHPQLFFLASQ